MKPAHYLTIILIVSVPPVVAHDHFAAGIVDANLNGRPDAGEPLQFVGANGTNKTFHLLARPVGQRCGGHYMLDESVRTLFPTDSFSLIALSDGQYEVKAPLHAHTGSWIWVEIASVTGPAGSNFGFWEENSQVSTHLLPANEPTGNPRFVISEGIDDADEDPQGHIHGRAWTADKAGDYQIGLRLVDRSTSGPNGGPWHAPSVVYLFHFTAGPDFQPKIVQAPGGSVILTWPGQTGIWQGVESGMVFSVQRAGILAPGGWQTLGTRTGTADVNQALDAATLQFTDPSPPPGRAFYRLSYEWVSP
jgi:hypothetical protein